MVHVNFLWPLRRLAALVLLLGATNGRAQAQMPPIQWQTTIPNSWGYVQESWQRFMTVNGPDQVQVASCGPAIPASNSFTMTRLNGSYVQWQVNGTGSMQPGQLYRNNWVTTSSSNATGTTATLVGAFEATAYAQLVQLDGMGLQRWSVPVPAAQDVVLDAADNCYVAGKHGNGSTATATLSKYTNSGQLQWTVLSAQSPVGALLQRVVLLPGGDVLGVGMRAGGGYVLLKASATGILLWSTSIALADVRTLCDVQVDGQGNVVLLGRASNPGQGLRYPGGFKLSKISGQGQLLWHTTYLDPNGTTAGHPMGLRLDAVGNAYVAGMLQDQGQPYAVTPQFVTAKYNTLGGQEWSQLVLAAAPRDSVRHIAVDAQGNVCVTGGRGNAALLLRYTTSGTMVWNGAYLPPGKTAAEGREVAFDPAGSAYLLLDQLPGTSNPLGSSELAVVKLPGTITGIRQHGKTQALNVWPNPARDWVQMQIPAGGQRLEMRNTLGQLVWRQDLPAGSGPVRLPVAALPAGVYMLSIGTASGLYQQRLVKE